MITKADIEEAISECIRSKNPTSNTCMKLAAYYIIADHIAESGSTEFRSVIDHADNSHVLQVFDELMKDLQAVNPMLYDRTIKRLKEGY